MVGVPLAQRHTECAGYLGEQGGLTPTTPTKQENPNHKHQITNKFEEANANDRNTDEDGSIDEYGGIESATPVQDLWIWDFGIV